MSFSTYMEQVRNLPTVEMQKFSKYVYTWNNDFDAIVSGNKDFKKSRT